MKPIPKRQFIFGSVFLYAKKLQLIGDRMDADVTMKQWLMLIMTSQFEQPPTLTELGDIMGCTCQNVKKLALKLRAKGLVSLEKDQRDLRALRVILTVECDSYYQKCALREQKYLDDLFKGFSEAEIDCFNDLFYKFGKNVFRIYEMTNDGNFEY